MSQNVLFNLPRAFARPLDGATPFYLGDISGFDLDMKQEIKSLQGQAEFTYLQLTGNRNLTGNFKTSVYSPELLALCLGSQSGIGSGTFIQTETITVPSEAPYEYAVTGLAVDLGVQSGGLTSYLSVSNMKKVATAPAAANEYQVSGGKYIFHADMAGQKLKVSYAKEDITATEVVIKNRQMGDTTPVELIFYTVSEKLIQTYTLTNATLAGMTISWKVADFGEASVDFACSARYVDDIALKISTYVKP